MPTIILVAIGVALAPVVIVLALLALSLVALALFWILIGIRNILYVIAHNSEKMFDRIFQALS